MEDMYKIFNDDCLNIIKDIDNKIHLVCVDLPYGQTSCKWDTCIDLDKMWVDLKKVCKEDCVYVFFCTTKFGISLINSNPKWFRYDIVWEKTQTVGFFNANKQPLRSHEMLYIFKKKQGCYNPQFTKGKPYKKREGMTVSTIYGANCKVKSEPNPTGRRYPISVIKMSNTKHKSKHKTQKPQKILEWIIKTYSNEGDTVLDFTMGSGSCGVASLNNNRKFIGIEMDKEIFKIAEERIKEET